LLSSGSFPRRSLTELDQYLLDELLPDKSAQSIHCPLHRQLTRLGGYLVRADDPQPGNTDIWRGLSRIIDIELGIMIGVELVGN
jgi:hypothetical protein